MEIFHQCYTNIGSIDEKSPFFLKKSLVESKQPVKSFKQWTKLSRVLRELCVVRHAAAVNHDSRTL